MKFNLNKFEKILFTVNIKNILLLLYIWLLLGFTMGTGLLMGPVRWIANYARANQVDESVESWIIKILILLLIASSFIISIYLVKIINFTFNSFFKYLILGLLFVFSATSVWLWFNPKIMQFNTEIVSEGNQNVEFIFGPYPDEEKIIELKEKNIDVIVSLLSKAVIPFEPKLLSDEIKITNKYGMKFINLPMLPWVSSNKTSLDQIKKLAREAKGKYYVHCYLGKDRVGIVRRAVAEILGKERISGNIDQRNIESIDKFERGEIIKLAEGIYLTPFPTDEEFLAFILNGNFQNVVSLLTEKNPEDVPWMKKEKKLLSEYGINYKLLPINLNSYNPEKLLNYIEIVRKLEKPVLVHAFLTPSPQSEMFTYSFNTGNPSLPKYLFDTMMRNGKVKFHNLSIAYGPKPLPIEIGGYLYKKGIRKIGFSGYENKEISLLKKIAKENKIEWVKISPNNIKIVNISGPWYLFGERLNQIVPLLKND